MLQFQEMALPNRKCNGPPETGDRKAVVILGMHRSGTSALSGALHLMGVDFGERLLPATDANQKGYWEHEEIVEAHDRLLSGLGSYWDDDKPLPPGWMEREITREVQAHLLGILERDFAEIPLFGLKDPRMCRLMALWLPIFQTLRVQPHFVLMVRHPWEVAESLTQRDGIEHLKSHFLWVEHLVEAESATRTHKRSFVTYEKLIDDPVATLDALRAQVAADIAAPNEVETALRQFLEPSLRHQRVATTAVGFTEPLPQLALNFYETIRDAATSPEITLKLKPLGERFISNRSRFSPGRIRTEQLSPEEVAKVSLRVSTPPPEVAVSTSFWVDADVENGTNEPLFSAAPYPVNLAYHWINKTTREMVVFDGQRTRLSPRLDPNSTARYQMKIVSPDEPGEYILQTTIVQERVCWFENIRPGVAQEFFVSVVAPANHHAASHAQEAAKFPQPAFKTHLAPGRVTIGLPIYRGKAFLEESLASVQSQTYREFDVIVSLDGPDPECEEICRAFLADPRFRLVVQPRRLGWKNHTNWLMSRAQTEFWHLQEQDDVIVPTFLETLVGYAVEHLHAAVCYSDLRTFGTTDTHLEMSPVIGSPVMRQMKLIHEHFQGVAPLGLFRTEALRMSGGLQANEFENFAADTALMAGLARSGELHRVPQELYRKRVHPQSTCASWWDWAMDRRFKAWQAHCLDMLRQALLVEATLHDRRILWLAVIERLVSPRTASHFLPVAELTTAERADMLDVISSASSNVVGRRDRFVGCFLG